jgi:hypothetical protein
MRPAAVLTLLAMATPAVAQPFQRGPLAPYPDHLDPENRPPLPEDFSVARPFVPQEKPRTAPDPAEFNLPRDVPGRLAACWVPPPMPANQVWQVTVRLSFTRGGEVIGTPATPWLDAPTSAEKRALRVSLLAAIRACTPLRFTASLGKAIAGRIFAIRFIVHHGEHDQRI